MRDFDTTFHNRHPRILLIALKGRKQAMLYSELMNSPEKIDRVIDAYINEHWEDVLADLQTLIAIPSFREDDKANPQENAPFGPGPRHALDAALEIAGRMGFKTHDVDGYIGYADYLGEEAAADAGVANATSATGDIGAASAMGATNANASGSARADERTGTETRRRQIGIIGHVDIVPAGPGWSVEPYAVTRKDGFLLGRGIADDKGPVVVALHAMNIWKQLGVTLPYDLRFLFGAAEETGMEDVPYYRERFQDPDFLFTPDAEFPVCYGEKGHYDGTLVSRPLQNGRIIDIQGGSAPNAVPGSAFAIVSCDDAATADTLPAAERITVTDLGNGTARIDAQGKCQHASIPEDGINAIGILVDYLLENNLCSGDERAFLQLEQQLLSCTDGSCFDCACSDKDFGSLTMVGGMISLHGNSIRQTIDCRFPTCITADEIEMHIRRASCACGASIWRDSCMEPFLVDPQSPEIQTLLRAYNEATGENAEPFTMGGGTYARLFSNAASFGPEKPWVPVPDWVGGMHSPNEGISEEALKEALRIYARVLIGF